MSDMYDLLVIGGVNGTGIARDAAGRGLKVLLCETGDLGEGTSSRSGKLIHGGLLYEREADFLCRTEWARSAEDVLKRRTKHYLRMSLAERANFAAWLARGA